MMGVKQTVGQHWVGGREKGEPRVTYRYLTWVTVEMDGGASQEDKRSKRLGRKMKISFRHVELQAPKGHQMEPFDWQCIGSMRKPLGRR